MLEQILENFPDETVLKIDNFDEAIIGYTNDIKLVYSYSKCIDILKREMEEIEAIEYFEYNIANTYMGEKTPIICYDNFS